jgi:hypothetical protein
MVDDDDALLLVQGHFKAGGDSYSEAFPEDTFLHVLAMVEKVAKAWDYVQQSNSGLQPFVLFEGNEKQLYARPLRAWTTSGTDKEGSLMPAAILAVRRVHNSL